MLQRNLLKDIQNITQISSKVLQKLNVISEFIICDDINELDILGENILEVDIGIGKLTFIVNEDSIQYDFCPSEVFEKHIVSTLEDKVNPVIVSSENALNKKLFNTYKELL